jgi:acyl carrier protein
VLDDAVQLAPIGVAGELWIAGLGLARGYRNQPELTRERFVTLPALPGVRLYRTGDIVRRTASGLIEFLGRADHQIKQRGFRIELDEIEACVRGLAQPRQCAVVAQRGPSGDPVIVAYLVDCPLPHEALRARLLTRLPDYMVPSAFVDLPELPTLTNGKLDRKALPEPVTAGATADRVLPRTASEELVSRVFADALRRDAVSVNDNFFDLGGHSLMASRIMLRLRAQTNLVLPLRLLFEHPTVGGLAAAIDASRWSERQSEHEIPSRDAGREEFEL